MAMRTFNGLSGIISKARRGSFNEPVDMTGTSTNIQTDARAQRNEKQPAFDVGGAVPSRSGERATYTGSNARREMERSNSEELRQRSGYNTEI